MVMAYESGRSLQDHILRRRERGEKPLVSERFIRKMFSQVMQGLREVHANKLLHLDLKPANIYLRLDGTPILLDFGAARQTLQRRPAQAVPDVHAGLCAARAVRARRRARAVVGHLQHRRVDVRLHGRRAAAAGRPAHERTTRWTHHFDKLRRRVFARADRGHTLVPGDSTRWQRPQSVFALQKALQPGPARAGARAATSLARMQAPAARDCWAHDSAQPDRRHDPGKHDGKTAMQFSVYQESHDRRPQGQPGPHGLQLHARRAAAGAGRRHGRPYAGRGGGHDRDADHVGAVPEAGHAAM